MDKIKEFASQYRDDLAGFAAELVRTRSYTGQEKNVIRAIEQKMGSLGYDDVRIDAMGNILGTMGTGPDKIMFDAHVDTVRVDDAEDWAVPPFSGRLVGDMLHGRGSVDMKSGAAAAVYAGYAAKRLGLLDGKTVYVSCTVMEEDCDGENLRYLFGQKEILPDRVVICEPSSCRLAVGHKGKAQIKITTEGVSAHGSAPEKGVNAVYKMAEVIRRVEALSDRLIGEGHRAGSVVLSNIRCDTASLNAIPVKCTIDLDRRTVESEDDAFIRREMDALVAGTGADWQIGEVHRTSWTGMDVTYHPFHPAWSIDLDHDFSKTALNAYRALHGTSPEVMTWDFSTNAVACIEKGIPTIGYGPGDSKLAHMKDEQCPVDEIVDALQFYAAVIKTL
jgi:putative selenium metabolism hydrolase